MWQRWAARPTDGCERWGTCCRSRRCCSRAEWCCNTNSLLSSPQTRWAATTNTRTRNTNTTDSQTRPNTVEYLLTPPRRVSSPDQFIADHKLCPEINNYIWNSKLLHNDKDKFPETGHSSLGQWISWQLVSWKYALNLTKNLMGFHHVIFCVADYLF